MNTNDGPRAVRAAAGTGVDKAVSEQAQLTSTTNNPQSPNVSGVTDQLKPQSSGRAAIQILDSLLTDKQRAEYSQALIKKGQARTGRVCGSCSLCCKLLPIAELEKPINKWCKHCKPGAGGCTIYADRPYICQGFTCQWLIDPALGDEWQPTRSKMVVRLLVDADNVSFRVHVDPGFPDIWKRKPYYQWLKHTARDNLENREEAVPIYVEVNHRVVLILPDSDEDVTDKFHLVMKIAGRWKVIPFDTKEQCRQYADVARKMQRGDIREV